MFCGVERAICFKVAGQPRGALLPNGYCRGIHSSCYRHREKFRYMFYVVSEDFLNSHGSENSVHAGYRWRSRREVVNWLTSMLSKQHGHDGGHSNMCVVPDVGFAMNCS